MTFFYVFYPKMVIIYPIFDFWDKKPQFFTFFHGVFKKEIVPCPMSKSLNSIFDNNFYARRRNY